MLINNVSVRGVYIERGELDPVTGALEAGHDRTFGAPCISLRLTPRETSYVLRQLRGNARREREEKRAAWERELATNDISATEERVRLSDVQ